MTEPNDFQSWQRPILDAPRPLDALRDQLSDLRQQQKRFEPYNIWIHALDDAEIERYIARLGDPESQPLWGLPFAIKDNIDLAGVETTAACPAYGYTPDQSAFVVETLINAGAIPVGKTNMDQFATGLVGTRSPHGAVRNAIDPNYISGGSSSGSAVAVATGLASFALGTDTAGSGRIPAAFNGLVGFKPSRGLWSTSGVVPACRSLDCVSVFTRTVADARTIHRLANAFDSDDPYARQLARGDFPSSPPRYGVLGEQHLGSVAAPYRAAYQAFTERLPNRATIDATGLLEAARLLYEGPWVAERASALGDFLEFHAPDVHPVTREIIKQGFERTAVDYFDAADQLARHRRACEALFSEIDVVVVPTAPTIHTINAVTRDPITTNTQLGTFTNFVNLLDLCAVAIPAGQASGMPFGVTLISDRGTDEALLDVASNWCDPSRAASPAPVAERAATTTFAVCGAHLTGQPLTDQLVDAGARLLETTTTAPQYRFYALPDGKRPALVRQSEGGVPIEVELFAVPKSAIGSLLDLVAPPLGFGSLELADGRWVKGFIAEGVAVSGSADISHFGGWRAYKANGEVP